MVDYFDHSLATEAIDERLTKGLLFGWGPSCKGAGV